MCVKLKPTLPEGEKNDRLDREELYDRVERHQHVLGRKVEQKQAVEGQADGEVVDDGDVDVSAIRAGKKKAHKHVQIQRSGNEYSC